uniref:Glycosyl transferase family 25 domain-containing protein n=1 Tax=viral metagenome TaxID=1070528 RepID=A0A6C0CF57_9ZZZZ
MKIFVINLDYRKDRFHKFTTNYNFPIEFYKIEAIDGYNLNDKYLNSVLGEVGKQSLKNKRRKYHYELPTVGAVGCYLSHVKTWKTIIYNNINDYSLIFEDDVHVCDIKFNDILERINNLPEDWDIYLLSNPKHFYDKELIYNDLYKVNRFFYLSSYVINTKACKKIIDYEHLFPINQQIDTFLSNVNLNIYVNSNQSYYKQHDDGKSNVQIDYLENLDELSYDPLRN